LFIGLSVLEGKTAELTQGIAKIEEEGRRRKKNITYYPLPITYYPLPITYYPLPITHYPLPITHYPLPITHYQN
ncbi:hypothetical protein MEO41_26635, partial [Dolichospermum sp. ST_sed4]|nr:hypothetical protein [Dolichospermum sp. ST_sed4]